MSSFTHEHGRRKIFFSDHALDRWWERCEQNDVHGRNEAMNLLRERLETAVWSRSTPGWAKISRWHRARAEGFLALDDVSGFVINRNPTGDRVAVTYIDSLMLEEAA
jgi:hypothetical protein